MSTSVTERQHVAAPARPRTRRAAVPAQRTAGPGERAAQRAGATTTAVGRSAAQRAYARRDDRLRRLTGGRPVKSAAPAGRAQFILLVMVLLGAGLVATLWLSTAAAADSYRLQDARLQTRDLTERSELLRREVTAMDAAPALARRAADLGLVAAKDPARLVVAADDSVTVVGDPRAAQAPAPPPAPPADPAAPVPGVPAAPAAPGAATPAAGTPPPATPAAAPAAAASAGAASAAAAPAAAAPAAAAAADPALSSEAATQAQAQAQADADAAAAANAPAAQPGGAG